MNAFDYLFKLDIDHNAKVDIARIMFTEESCRKNNPNYMKNVSKKHWKNYLAKRQVPEDFKIIKDPISIMTEINQMVKDESCPRNYKNRFYSYKTSVIKRAIKDGRLTKALDCGHFLELTIDGKYVFHQIKDYGWNGWLADGRLKCDGEGVYEKGSEPIPFVYDKFKDFQVSAIYYIHRNPQA